MSTGIIYCAHCLVTGKKYIGQTIQKFNIRISAHKSNAKYCDHKFHRAIKKYGWDNFIWGIIEECPSDKLNLKEQYWVCYYNTYNDGYNSTLGGNSVNPKTYRKFNIMDPDGKIHNVSNISMSEFCRIYDLKQSEISRVLSGIKLSHRGWKLPETKLIGVESAKEKISTEFKLISPNGEVFCGKNRKEFCVKNNLDPSEITKVIKGKVRMHKGWTAPLQTLQA